MSAAWFVRAIHITQSRIKEFALYATDNPGPSQPPKAKSLRRTSRRNSTSRSRQIVTAHALTNRTQTSNAPIPTRRLLQPPRPEAPHLDLGSPPLFLRRRHFRRLRPASPSSASFSRRIPARSPLPLDRPHRRPASARAPDLRPRPSAPLPEHVARLQMRSAMSMGSWILVRLRRCRLLSARLNELIAPRPFTFRNPSPVTLDRRSCRRTHRPASRQLHRRAHRRYRHPRLVRKSPRPSRRIFLPPASADPPEFSNSLVSCSRHADPRLRRLLRRNSSRHRSSNCANIAPKPPSIKAAPAGNCASVASRPAPVRFCCAFSPAQPPRAATPQPSASSSARS